MNRNCSAPVPAADRPDEPEKKTRIPWWSWPHVLSLEAPVIAVIWQSMMARTHQIALMPAMSAGLALAVWLIYVTDRLLDGLGEAETPSDTRHAFYRRHWRLFAWIVIPAAAAGLVWIALFHIPQGLLWQCLALALLIMIYLACFPARHHRRIVGALGGLSGIFIIVVIFLLPMAVAPKIQFAMIGLLMMTFGFFHRLDSAATSRIPKEPLGSLLFALGCSAGVQFFSMSDGIAALSIDVLLLWGLFGLNMLGISCAEMEAGGGDAHSVTRVWPRVSRLHPIYLFAGIAICGVIALTPHEFPVRTGRLAACVGMSVVLLAFLWLGRARLSPLCYRVLADLALVVPAVWLLF